MVVSPSEPPAPQTSHWIGFAQSPEVQGGRFFSSSYVARMGISSFLEEENAVPMKEESRIPAGIT